MIQRDMAANVARKRHFRGLLRMSAYLGVLTLGIGAFQVRAVHAEMKRRTLDLGRDMVKLAASSDQELNQVVFNGQSMFLGSATSTLPVKDVLDRYEGFCKENRAQSIDEWRALDKKNTVAKVDASSFATGVVREMGPGDGMVLCFVKSASAKPSLVDAMKAFGETGDLGALGAARYVYAKKTDAGQTLVLTSWTDDTFNVQKLLPEEGRDVAGVEFDGIPRVADSQRVLSARVEGSPFGLNVYRSKDAPLAVAAFYDREMQQRGWFAFDPEIPDKGPNGEAYVGRIYEKDGVVLTLGLNVEQGATFAALGLAGVEAKLRNVPRATR